MALINCPECGKQISDQAKTCPNCGFKIKRKMTKEEKKKVLKTCSIVFGVLVLLTALGVGAFFSYKYYFAPLRVYKEAGTYAEAGNYDEAIRAYSGVIDFKDSEARVTECNYLKAKNLLENAELDAAKEIFDRISYYEDSSNLSKECTYRKANRAFDKKDYETAILLFSGIEGYSDASTMVKECKYQTLIQSFEGKKLYSMPKMARENFINGLEELGDYNDSTNLVLKLKKEAADELQSYGRFEEAIEWYEQVLDYADSKDQCLKCYDSLIKTAADKNNYSGIIDVYKVMSSKGYDGAQDTLEAYCEELYTQATDSFKAEDFETAKNIFYALYRDNYKDAGTQYQNVLTTEKNKKEAAEKAKKKASTEAAQKKTAENAAAMQPYNDIAGTWVCNGRMLKMSGKKWDYYVDQEAWRTFKSFGLGDTFKYESGVYYFYDSFWDKTYAGVLNGDQLTFTLYQNHNPDRAAITQEGTYTRTSTSID